MDSQLVAGPLLGRDQGVWKFQRIELDTLRATVPEELQWRGRSIAVVDASSPNAHIHARLGNAGNDTPVRLNYGSVFSGIAFETIYFGNFIQSGEWIEIATHESPHAQIHIPPRWPNGYKQHFAMIANLIAAGARPTMFVAPSAGWELWITAVICDTAGLRRGVVSQTAMAAIWASGPTAYVPMSVDPNLQATFETGEVTGASQTALIAADSLMTTGSANEDISPYIYRTLPHYVPDGSGFHISQNVSVNVPDLVIEGYVQPAQNVFGSPFRPV